MFTGIIAQTGTTAEKTDRTMRIDVGAAFSSKLTIGDSIAVNGICLTATIIGEHDFTIEYMPETARLTTIGDLQKGSLVNLELPPTPTTFLSGHIVQGHIDGIGRIADMAEDGNSRILTVTVDPQTARSIVHKGSIALNGISLTVIDANDNSFRVGIIPHTWNHTMLRTIAIQDRVNIETDVLAKYLERHVSLQTKS
jgi:riboflavin synthase